MPAEEVPEEVGKYVIDNDEEAGGNEPEHTLGNVAAHGPGRSGDDA